MTAKSLIKILKQMPPESEIRVLNKDGEPKEPAAVIPDQRAIGFLAKMYWVIVS